jgi:2-polyprenyl-3-methyl-5-hydroxy-6-metoxy-1,4-benzoquinol methylase
MCKELIKKGSDEHKYTNKNFFHRLFLNRFLDTAFYEINQINPKTILDFGCGEGFFLKGMKDRGLSGKEILGLDIRKESLERAKKRVPEYDFRQLDLFQINPDKFRFDLVMAVEVLEHLYEPETYLKRLVSLSAKNVLFTVPFEPWFRVMNFLRGRDILRLGNHPEHVNH